MSEWLCLSYKLTVTVSCSLPHQGRPRAACVLLVLPLRSLITHVFNYFSFTHPPKPPSLIFNSLSINCSIERPSLWWGIDCCALRLRYWQTAQARDTWPSPLHTLNTERHQPGHGMWRATDSSHTVTKSSHYSRLTAIPTGLALWRCGQTAGDGSLLSPFAAEPNDWSSCSGWSYLSLKSQTWICNQGELTTSAVKLFLRGREEWMNEKRINKCDK